MATAREQGYRTGLVNMTAGRISREIFVNEEIYKEELERLFARVWLFVGHESQIPKPGDYFVSGMGEESVLPLAAHRRRSGARAHKKRLAAGGPSAAPACRGVRCRWVQCRPDPPSGG